jgi:KDO2-lipid IV(A) lauroyltransferase
MTNIKYFLQFILIFVLFSLYKIIGLKAASYISAVLFKTLGPIFRSKKIIHANISKALPNLNEFEKNKIINEMWCNYGKIFAEYMFIKEFRNGKFSKKITIENQKILEKIKNDSSPVIFISGHFNNFELMAMHIEKSGIKLSAIYRPLNNKFLNPLMEGIRVQYICKNQIKKGSAGTRKLVSNFKNGQSVALMIDQRVSEGIKSKFFDNPALTTTIPAQFVKKFKTKIVPIYIERLKNDNFNIKIHNPINFSENETLDTITLRLNKILEKMILHNPNQWIWTHNRWK